MLRMLIVITAFAFTGASNGALARDDASHDRFQSFVSVIGPVDIGVDNQFKLCATDVSVVTRLGARGAEKYRSRHPYNGRFEPEKVVWSSTRVEVFDSTDTTRPLPVRVDDLVFASGKGACTTIHGYEIGADGLSRSVIILLTTLTEARAVFDPLATGQLAAPNTSPVGLLVPAVQSAREPGNGAGICCACAPVCGCGICD